MKFSDHMNLEWLVENIKALPMSAQSFATMKHQDQSRKFTGEPYVEHPKRVSSILKRFKSSHRMDDLMKAAMLHDTLEDTDTTIQDLRKLFGGLVASLVQELSNNPEEIRNVGKTKHITDKMTSMSSWGLVIKLADRLDNISDLDKAGKKFADKYSRETRKILDVLKSKRKLSGTQRRMVKAIEIKLTELGF